MGNQHAYARVFFLSLYGFRKWLQFQINMSTKATRIICIFIMLNSHFFALQLDFLMNIVQTSRFVKSIWGQNHYKTVFLCDRGKMNIFWQGYWP